MWVLQTLCAFIVIYGVFSETETNFSMSNLITKFGYRVEIHRNIPTRDGYLLDIYRIPPARQRYKPNQVVLLMHGLAGSSEHFVIGGPNISIAFFYANKGYDVWLGNSRGTLHGRKHIHLNPDKDKKFWDFSWHEIGIYDLPAIIDYILRVTRQNKLHYVGHSQGTTVFFVMASELPQYNRKIKNMIALAPSVYLTHMTNIGGEIIKFMVALLPDFLNVLEDTIGPIEIFPSGSVIRQTTGRLCNINFMKSICAEVITLLAGRDPKQISESIVPLIAATGPAGCSSKQIYHYLQNILKGGFYKYDYRNQGNMIRYGTPRPPSYMLSKVSTPIALIAGPHDDYASPEDVQRLSKELQNVVMKYTVPFDSFNHIDYIFGTDAKKLVHNKMFEINRRFE